MLNTIKRSDQKWGFLSPKENTKKKNAESEYFERTTTSLLQCELQKKIFKENTKKDEKKSKNKRGKSR